MPFDILGFAVTDQFCIIPLREVSRSERGGFWKVETEICGAVDPQEHCEDHHDCYFKTLFLEESGGVNIPRVKDNVFMSFDTAKEYALKEISEAISLQERYIASLRSRRNHLNELTG